MSWGKYKTARNGRHIKCTCGWTAQFDTLRDAQRMGATAITEHETRHLGEDGIGDMLDATYEDMIVSGELDNES